MGWLLILDRLARISHIYSLLHFILSKVIPSVTSLNDMSFFFITSTNVIFGSLHFFPLNLVTLSYNALIFLLEHGQIISSIQSYKIFRFNLIGILLSHKTLSDEATLGPKGALAPKIFEKQLIDNINI